jgi:hypothetical protein
LHRTTGWAKERRIVISKSNEPFMINLRVASATVAVLLCMKTGDASAAVWEAQYRTPAEQTGSGDGRVPSSEREPRAKERTPPPRPIVPPEGQQQNPALREDCAWLGQRIVSLLVRDDPMTGNDFVPFYQRFGCPQEHLGKAFACVVGFGIAENEALADRVAQCWTDPGTKPRVPAPAAKKPGDPADTSKEGGEHGDKQPSGPADESRKPADIVPPPVSKPANGAR